MLRERSGIVTRERKRSVFLSADPILVLQMQRMGDLVLSFPLMGWLARYFPGHPLWVVGEKQFFAPLMPLSPPATYFSYGGKPALGGVRFHLVINLSHRPEAAALAGSVEADALVGPYMDNNGTLRIRGDWQLYRASLTHNNRYNLFHWTDLNALDVIPSGTMLRTDWPLPHPVPARQDSGKSVEPAVSMASGARVGLFLGASEPDKHPDASFWIALTRRLLAAGHKPVLLGGTAEKPLGYAVASALKAHALNLCGHFSIDALVRFLRELHLLVTPDTGPMHIATWTGVPVLNLSLGPVNPWETGPFAPGHHVLRAALPCAGCWRCTQPAVHCKEHMTPQRVSTVVSALLTNDREALCRPLPGLELFRTARGLYGLHTLVPLTPSPSMEADSGAPDSIPEARQLLARVWQAWFGHCFGRFSEEDVTRTWRMFAGAFSEQIPALREGLAALICRIAQAAKQDTRLLTGDSLLLQQTPPPLRPLSGYIQMYAQNASDARPALLHTLERLEALAALWE